MTPKSSMARSFRRHSAAFIAGFLALAVLLGGGVSWAYWTSTLQGSGTLSTTAINVTVAPNASLNDTFTNTFSTLTQVGTFKVTNPPSNTVSGDVSATLSGSGIASGFPVRIWVVGQESECTTGAAIPANATSGTWGNASTPTVANLAVGASVLYCVRTAVNPDTERNNISTAVTGDAQISPTITATLTPSGWGAKTATATATLATDAIYPLVATNWQDTTKSRWYQLRAATADGNCLDVAGIGANGEGNLVSNSCSGAATQAFEIGPVASDARLVGIRPAQAPLTRVGLETNLNQRTFSNYQSGSSPQSYVQHIGGNVYQFVTRYLGVCLTLSTTTTPANGRLAATDCNSTAQNVQFYLARIPFTFNNDALSNVTVSWQVNPGTRIWTLQTTPTGATAWTARNTSTGTDKTWAFSTVGMANGTYDLRVVDDTGNVIYSGMSFTKSGTSASAGAGFG